MGQFNFKKSAEKLDTPPEWLPVSAAVGRMAITWSGRYDIVARVSPEAGQGNPACYNPHTSEVEINVETCFSPMVSPTEIEKIDERQAQYDWPKATGAIFHEACHARFSRWDLEVASATLKPAEFTALVLLEEGRIERAGLEVFPSNAGFLRATALSIVLDDAENVVVDSDTVFAANLAALALARVDAGSLERDDVEEIEALIEKKLGAPVVDRLRTIWREAQKHVAHFDATQLYELAREWVRVVDSKAEENGDKTSDETSNGSGEPVSIDGELSDFVRVVYGALEDAADAAEIAAFGAIEDARTREEWEQQMRSKANDRKISKEAAETAAKVFGHGTGVIDGCTSSSRLVEERAPRGDERAAAVKIANLLEKAKYRDRSETEISSVVPPGRLRTRSMVQGAALKSKGVTTTLEPWRRTVRKHTDDPTLSIGVMVDISGSMNAAMEPMATTAWVLSEAVRRVQGKAAMVYYGNDVFPTLKPGQHLDRVAVYNAPDMTEKFDKAFKALNGGLNLLGGSGARLLVVFSDGEYPSAEQNAAKRWLSACQQTGVGVLWLCLDSKPNWSVSLVTRGSHAVVVRVPTDPTRSAVEIGQAAAKALMSVS